MKNVMLVLAVLLGTMLSANAQTKIAYINTNELATSMPETVAANKALQDFQKEKQSLLETMDAERKKKISLYEQKYRELSEANREVLGKELAALEKEITDMAQRIQETAEKSEQELEQKQELLFAPIIQKASDAVKAVAREKGYTYVLDTSQPGVVYFEGDDLLETVQNKLGITKTAGN